MLGTERNWIQVYSKQVNIFYSIKNDRLENALQVKYKSNNIIRSRVMYIYASLKSTVILTSVHFFIIKSS